MRTYPRARVFKELNYSAACLAASKPDMNNGDN
jgi:hypothetical protein